ncbi:MULTISPECIES: methionine ABC transporter ATP-binding protein [unclassified Duganella]|uniref:methionine ABC transporter ATP-binding protein n=1 Tax=unclassified Duganella TaxID=2636909 RepID=UPI0006F8FAF3|nr:MULTISPECIES: ATP-binding cassette domain-containing protein [unclassified Duganella]KQV61782.1 ABC transporter ATP-binding protein [Duganella sp. Root336D2]KRB84288.1 ABC transporter ATP-binding protein [Duganella sp. Root198D2]
MTTPLIQLDQVERSFAHGPGERLHAVRGISLSIQRGEIFGLAGKSGAGKSTLLRMINLLERPDSGRVVVDGDDLTALGKRELRTARQNIGMIFQQFNLLRNATVAGNVAFPLRIHGAQSPQEIALRVQECLALVDLEEKASSYPSRLSGGQQQRVAIARALASKPAVLLCDEPASALDAETTRALLATLQDVNRRLGVTIVIVSHELDVLASICQRVAVIENGVVAEQFRVADWQAPRRTALGRELAALSAQAALATDVSLRKEPVHV